MMETLRHKAAGAGVLNTTFIERFNGTRRGPIAALGRRTRALAGRGIGWHWAMYLTGTVYNFCCEHASWRRPGLIGGHKWWGRTPAMAAGLTDQCWTMEELLNDHVPPPPLDPAQVTRAILTGAQSSEREVGLLSTLKCSATPVNRI